jgi:hypothetical protein
MGLFGSYQLRISSTNPRLNIRTETLGKSQHFFSLAVRNAARSIIIAQVALFPKTIQGMNERSIRRDCEFEGLNDAVVMIIPRCSIAWPRVPLTARLSCRQWRAASLQAELSPGTRPGHGPLSATGLRSLERW